MHSVLLGEGVHEQAQADLILLGFTPQTTVRALCGTDDNGLEEILDWLHAHGRGGNPAGLAAVAGPYVLGFVRDPPPAAPPRLLGMGPVVDTAGLRASLPTAQRAFAAGLAAGLRGTQSVEDLGLLLPIVDDDQVGDPLVRRFVEPLQRTQSNRAILTTVRHYLDDDLNVDQVARLSFLHPNTIRYRLHRYERFTGAQLHNIRSLTEVSWALRRADLRGSLVSGQPERVNLRRAESPDAGRNR